MNNERITYTPFEEYREDRKGIDIRERLNKFLYHWPLFFISIFICLSLAYVHLKFTSPIYTVRAKLLIKAGGGTENSLSERDLFKGTKMIENEIEILKSRTLMKQVVADLQLWTRYERLGEFKNQDIYASTPVRFSLMAPGRPFFGQAIEIKIEDENTFILRQPNSELRLKFNSPLRSRFGLWTLSPTGQVANYVGSTIRITLDNPESVTHNYLNSVGVALSKESTVVDLSIRDYIPERAENVINRLIVAYNRAAIADRNKVSESTLRFIEDRLASITGELTAVEKDVEGYKSSRGLTDLSSKSQMFLENVKNNDGKLNEVKLQLQVINEIERYINSTDNSGIAPATVGISDPVLLGLINKLMTLESQKDRLLATTPEGNPIFEPINRQINTTKSSIAENIKGIKATLKVTENQLNNFNSSFKASIREIPGQEREFISIKRQQSIKEDLYIYLLQKREEAAVSYASTESGSRVVDPAYYVKQEAVNRPYTYSLALVLGLILPACLVFTRDLLNNRIQSSKEIQDAIPAPILGELSFQQTNTPLVITNTAGRIIGEQFRALRTNLIYAHGKQELGKITLFTSGMPGDGKSFVACNLGTALANAGRKTVILELDFRKPAILKSFDLKNTVGLSNYLIGQASKEEIIRPSGLNPNLFIIGTGPLPPNPSELLEQPEMEELLTWLRRNFDEILLDTPPVLLVTDAMILSKHSDANLYIIRQGYTYKSQLESVNQLYREQKLKKLNIVFNGVSSRGNQYGYSYYNTDEKPGFRQIIQDFFKRF